MRSCAMSHRAGRMEAAGRTTSARRRNHQPRNSPGFMLLWLVTTARARSQPAWRDVPLRSRPSSLEKAMPSLSHARFLMRRVRAGRHSPARRGQRSKIWPRRLRLQPKHVALLGVGTRTSRWALSSRLTNAHSSVGARKQHIADFDLVGEFAADQAGKLRLLVEELPELAPVEGNRSQVAFGNHRCGGQLVGQESDLADEATLLQMRDFAPADHDSGAAGANEKHFLERLVLLGKRRPVGKIDERAGANQARDL